jgi:hypothetical protein
LHVAEAIGFGGSHFSSSQTVLCTIAYGSACRYGFSSSRFGKELFALQVRQILRAVNFYVLLNGAQRVPLVHGHGARSAGIGDARAPRYCAQFYESASDEEVDVARASAKRPHMDNSLVSPTLWQGGKVTCRRGKRKGNQKNGLGDAVTRTVKVSR